MVVVVTGMHRSGTSAVTELLIAGGLDGGPLEAMMPASPANERGYFERVDVMHFNNTLLDAVGAHWVAPPADPSALAELAAGALGDEARVLLESISATSGTVVVKDPRFCLTLPFWIEALPGALEAVVLMYRDPREVAASLRVRDGIADALAMYLWRVYNTAALTAARDLAIFPIEYGELLHDPEKALEAFEAAVPAFSIQRGCENSPLVAQLRNQHVMSSDGLDEPAASLLASLRSRGPGRGLVDVAPVRDEAVQVGLSAVAVAEREFRQVRDVIHGQLLAVQRELEATRAAVGERQHERDVLATERDVLAAERDVLAAERDVLAAERDVLVVERDEAQRKLAEIAAADPLEGADPLVRRLIPLKERVGRSAVGKWLAPIYRRLIGS